MTKAEIEEMKRTAKELGFFNIFTSSIIYHTVLFMMAVAMIILFDVIFKFNFNSQISVMIVTAIFIFVFSIDSILSSKGKITPVAVIILLSFSVMIILSNLFKNNYMFNLNLQTINDRLNKCNLPIGVYQLEHVMNKLKNIKVKISL